MMTHTKIIQYIIRELSANSFLWNTEEELFEKMFFPIEYGNNHAKELTALKRPIKNLFIGKDFNVKKFDELANNIPCDNNKKSKSHRNYLKIFIKEELEKHQVKYIGNINQLLEQLICTKEGYKNYRSNFDSWKNIKNSFNIKSQPIKTALQINFALPVDIWDKQTNANQINAIKKGIDFFLERNKFKENHPDGIYLYTKNLFDEINSKYKSQYTTTDDEKDDLIKLRKMNHEDTMMFLHSNYGNQLSQAFILRMIPILFAKGFYALALEDGIEALDLILRNDITIKKIRAHALGSQEVAKYDEAYEILSNINSDNDSEIIDMQTSAISNMRRFQLTDKTLEKEKLKQILTTLIDYYQIAFNYKESYHYYPGVNLAYMQYIENIIFHKNNNLKSIFENSKASIELEKNSTDQKKQYYANISYMELLLLSQDSSFESSFESRIVEYLDELDLTMDEDKYFYVPLLKITTRQFQFIIDVIEPYTDKKNIIYNNLKRALNLVKDKIKYS